MSEQPNPGSSMQYFRPGRTVLCLKHHPEVAAETLTHWANTFLSEEAGSNAWAGRLRPPTEHQNVCTLSGVGDGTGWAYSLLGADQVDQRASALEETDFFGQIHDWHQSDALRGEPKAITAEAASDNRPAASLLSATPDWLMSSAFHMTGTGGPGAWPVQAQVPVAQRATALRIQFPQNPELHSNREPLGEGVDVAILDTAPGLHARVQAYHFWREHRAEENPLLEELLAPAGPLTIRPMPEADLWQIHYSLADAPYRMADHGLFIAGLIHSIAPGAKLHLHEVLNPWGIGSWQTIADGLGRALREHDFTRPLIINASLMLNLPRSVRHRAPGFPDAWRTDSFIHYTTSAIREIFGQLANDTRIVMVAAAGNDRATDGHGAATGTRPEARFPAAFANVVGVGALPKDIPQDAGRFRPASYSNLADDPLNAGFMTIGGEPGEGNGLLGAYLDDVPVRNSAGEVEYVVNKTGLAWWAGTSFATPIITGALAAWWGKNSAAYPPEARTALTQMAQRVPDASADSEAVIVAYQG